MNTQFREELTYYSNEIKSLKLKDFILPSVLAGIFFYPVLHAGVFYADDLFRSYFGTFGWYHLVRPIADITALFYSSTIDLNKPKIVDPFPLSWFICIGLITLASIFIRLKLARQKADTAYWMSLIFIINPFFVQNLLYRFDSIGMSISISMVALAFYLRDNKAGFFAKVVLLLLCLFTYQTFFNLYAGLTAVSLLLLITPHSLNNQKRLKRVFRKIVFMGGVILLTSLIYFVVVKIFSPAQTTPRAALIALGIDTPLVFITNLLYATKPFWHFWSFFIPYISILLPLIAWFCIKCLRQKTSAIVFLTAIGLLIFSTIGFMALLEKQVVMARGLPYFPIALMFIFYALHSLSNMLSWTIALPLFACFLFSSRVGNTLALQSQYEGPILLAAAQDIMTIDQNARTVSVGEIAIHPVANQVARRTPFNAFLSRTQWKTGGRLLHAGVANLEFHWSGDATRAEAIFTKDVLASPKLLVDKSPFYRIYTHNNDLWIHWSPDKSLRR